MLFISKFFTLPFVIILILSLSILTFADTIRMKDGRVVKGKIVSFEGGRFTVTFDDGTRQRQVVYSADEVESIAFESGSIPTDNVKVSSQIPANISSDENNTIITVGQSGKITNPQTTSPKTSPTTSVPTVSTPNTSPILPKPITVNVRVLADSTTNGWTNSGWVVRQGQKIKIVGSGRISLGGRFSTPGGVPSLEDANKLMKNQPTGGLIAVVGDDNNDFIFIGDTVEFTASRDGALFLGVNEGNLDDNNGAFDVKIEIYPDINN